VRTGVRAWAADAAAARLVAPAAAKVGDDRTQRRRHDLASFGEGRLDAVEDLRDELFVEAGEHDPAALVRRTGRGAPSEPRELRQPAARQAISCAGQSRLLGCPARRAQAETEQRPMVARAARRGG